jgi:hypothetical protein
VLHGFKPESTRHFLPLDASATLWRQDEDMEGDAQRDAESCRKTLNDLLARPTLGEEGRTLAQYLFLCEESMSSSDNQDHVDLGKTDCQGSIRSSLGGELVWHAMCKEILPCQAGRGIHEGELHKR